MQVAYDLETMRLTVDGQKTATFPCRGPGLYDTTSVLGGFGSRPDTAVDNLGRTGWYAGLVRSLRIEHNALPPATPAVP